ncbi:Signal transduction histidine kinase [Tistlia consotensis]|uniref:histidine kinase n=1 Tax=Tistlia consotensis USBA 355 TaxID=560819 RepID=A0A1Y6CC85_9PROT|nr:HAMP domain-containing sensor histidine kinase [Tistlia consotensis]SMF54255.1 Signal transduction histidine kinase [Tistlia consotensis USBA 355]SNR86746.1 Signal transduction histidine kinase [Tistlia consotensis]
MTGRLPHPRNWPVTVKVPVLVAGLMVIVSLLVTDRVLERLVETQERHLDALAGTYLDGLSSAVLPDVLRADVWEVFDALDRARLLYQDLNAVETIVTDTDGGVIAASDPRRHPSRSRIADERYEALPPGHVLIDERRGEARVRRILTYQARPVGAIDARLDVSGLLAERREVLTTLLLTNLALTLLMAAVGYLAVRRMMRPVQVLSDHLSQGQQGRMVLIPDRELAAPGTEFGQLFRRYNAMASAVNEREMLSEQLAREETLASLGRLASGMAHEINNPLGGLFNTIDTLRRHGEKQEVRERSIELLGRGLAGIRDVVRASLVAYRSDRAAAALTREDLEDLRVLVEPELRRKRLRIDWDNRVEGPLALPGGAVRDVLLNLLLNACAATPEGGRIGFEATTGHRVLRLVVEDEGPGLPDKALAYLSNPQASRAPVEDRSGLGLWMVRRLVDERGGSLEARNKEAGGAWVGLTLPERAPEKAEELRHVA